ncbi:UrvD/REP family ATP-dependent DNA helicase [Herbiconiux sp.]|uniref:UrvD/REP family ATP-dependent DNA helicase n=1 Tax=Herbiconiux sp. TaxID=1871186 RepID=UPI0025BCF7D2|nr:UrvD/REP family ATP-dependent DNA helicase [Herbiconiux sp.]
MNETGSPGSGTSGEIDAGEARSMAHALDEQQRSVLERPVGDTFAVIGAPGTGKTSTLIELVADRVLRCGFAPESILVLAASRQAATRLRDTVALRLGLVSNGPLARTASSAAFEIVRAAGAATAVRSAGERARPVVLLTGAEQDRILAELLEGGIQDAEDGLSAVPWPDSLTPEVRRLRAFRTELRELMMRATENGVSAGRLAQLGERFELPEWVAAAAFLRDYVAALEGFESAHLDSAELLAEARRLVREGGVLGHIRLIAVDELQEFPVGALNLVRELARAGAAVVAFGDPDAATAGFRGSDVRALGQLSRALGVPAGPPVVLRTSYRQRGAVRELTRRVTERIGAAAAGSQRATTDAMAADAATPADGERDETGDGSAIVAPGYGRGADGAAGRDSASGRDSAGRSEVLRIQADSRAGEIASIARLLRERFLLHGVGWAKMAVIVRSGSLVPAVARGLALAEVPTRTLSAVQALRDDYAARHLAEGLALAMGRLEPTPAAVDSIILGPLCGVDPVGLRRLRLALRHDELAIGGTRHADELLREALFMPGALVAIDSSPARRVAALGTTLKLLAESHREGATVEELLWQLWQRTGLAKRWGDLAAGSGIVADEANRNLDGAVALFTAAKRSVEREPERAAELFIDEFLTAEVPEDTLSPRSRSESVLVTTPSGAVGASVEIVVVAGLQESVWPNLRLRGSLLHAPRLSAVASGAAADLDQADDTRADVLADELRMFALAVSRSSRTTVLSCVANDDEQPSPFFGFAPDAGEYSAPRHPLSLRGLTGSLRRRVAVDGDRRAASVLARLATERVPGAHPSDWYGLKQSSTEEPVLDPADPDALVRVSPSRIEAFEQSPLMWFIDQVAGGSKSLAAGIGTIVHAVMEKVAADPDADLSPEELMRESEQRWRELRFEAPWIEQREKRALGTKLDGLSDYLRDFSAAGDELLGAEAGFELRIGRAQLAGSIDRVERRHDGRVLVIDLKTGKYPLSKADLPGNAQLAAYQLAVRSGAVDGLAVPVDGDDPAVVQGGAALLYVAKGEAGVRFTLRSQEPLDDDALQQITERIEKVAEGMAAARFPGVADPEERDLQNRYDYRIQLIKAVSE